MADTDDVFRETAAVFTGAFTEGQRKFYGHFAAAYGTFWLLLLLLAIITQSHINTGLFGLLGFPVISLVYAYIRIGADPSPSDVTWLRQRIAILEQELAQRPRNDFAGPASHDPNPPDNPS